jgi:tetratricopeptide (TPR) repeat protein
MQLISPHLLMLTAWGVALLGARLSAELATAANGVAWLLCAAFLLRAEHLREGLRLTLTGLATAAIGLIWLIDSYGVLDPHSAWSWFLGWGAPVLAGFVMARRSESQAAVYRGLACLGALLGAATFLVWCTREGRASALFSNPNITAAVLVGMLPFALAWRQRKHQLMLAAIMLVGLASTGSRGGILAAAAMIAAGLLVWRPDRRAWLAAVAALLVIAPFGLQRVSRLVDNPYAQGRMLWWRAAWRVSQDHPQGVGTRQFGWHGLRKRDAVQAPVYQYLRGEAGESAHSEWVQLYVDHGPLAPLLLLLAAVGLLARRHRRLELLALIGLLVHAAVDGTWQSEMVRMLLLCHAMALWRFAFAIPGRLPAPAFLGVVLLWVAAALPVGLAQTYERRALRSDHLAARQGRVHEADLARLKRATELSPLDPDPLAATARILVRARRWKEAYSAVEAAIKRAPSRPQLRRLACTLYAQAMAVGAGNTATALARFRHAKALIRLQPMHAVDRFELAKAALGLGYPRAARQALRTAVSLEPNYRVGYLALAGLEPLQAEAHFKVASKIRQQMLARYCPESQAGCRNHIQSVMTRLENRLLGDLVEGKDRMALVERFASWPRPPLVPWSGVQP